MFIFIFSVGVLQNCFMPSIPIQWEADDTLQKLLWPQNMQTLFGAGSRSHWPPCESKKKKKRNKTKCMCFNQKENTSILNGSYLKLVDNFTYLGSSVLLLKVTSIWAKAWIAIDRLSIIWKSDLSNKMKRKQWLC